MLNGFAYDCIFRPSGATFLVFADYCAAFHPAGLAGRAAGYLHLHA